MSTLLSATAGFVLGIFIRSIWIPHTELVWFFIFLAAVVTLRAYIAKTGYLICAAIFGATFLLGMFRTAVFDTLPPPAFAADVTKKVSYQGMVTDDPDVRDRVQYVTVSVSKNGVSTKILATISRNESVALGDHVQLSGTLAIPKPVAENDGRTFRYDLFLQKSSIRFTMPFASLLVISNGQATNPFVFFAHVKHFFLNGVNAVLPEPYASLAGGIVIGGKQGLGADLLKAFTLSGLVQIVVLSGYNVMIVAEVLMAFLASLHLSRKVSAVCGALALVTFIAIAGAGAATLRAGVMALIALFAKATGRTYAAGRALLLGTTLLLLWNPLLLVFDPGFDLSVVATAGLIWISPVFEIAFSFIKNEFWKSAVATTVAAQVAVLPILLYETGTLSLVSIPANLVTAPFVPAAMGFSAIAGIVGAVSGAHPFSILIAFPAYLLNAYLIEIARLSVTLPFSTFTIPAFSFYAVVLSYVALITLTLLLHRRIASQSPSS